MCGRKTRPIDMTGRRLLERPGLLDVAAWSAGCSCQLGCTGSTCQVRSAPSHRRRTASGALDRNGATGHGSLKRNLPLLPPARQPPAYPFLYRLADVADLGAAARADLDYMTAALRCAQLSASRTSNMLAAPWRLRSRPARALASASGMPPAVEVGRVCANHLGTRRSRCPAA